MNKFRRKSEQTNEQTKEQHKKRDPISTKFGFATN